MVEYQNRRELRKLKIKILITAVVAIVLALAILIAVPLYIRYDDIETNKELDNLLLLYEHGAEARGISPDGETVLTRANLARVITLLSFIERTFVIFPPQEGEAEAVIRIDETEIHIVSAQPVGNRDKVLIYYTNGSKKRCYSLVGYSTMQTVVKAISPKGYSGENTIV